MAIPTYDQLVSNPGAISGGGVQLTKSPDIVGQDAITMGKGLDSVGDAINKVAVRNEYLGYLNRKADEKALLDTQVNEINLVNMDFESQMREQTGINAIGMSQRYSDMTQEWKLENEKKIPEALRAQWNAGVDAEFIKGLRIVSTYESEQKQAHRESAFNSRVESTQARLMNESFVMRDGQLTDHPEFQRDLQDFKILIANRGVELGMSRELIDLNVQKATSAVISTRVSRLVDTDAQMAPAYFKQVADLITDPEERKRLGDLVDTASDRAEVDARLERLFNNFDYLRNDPDRKNLAREKEKLRNQYDDPEKRAYAMAQFDLREAGMNDIMTEENDRRNNDAWTRIVQSGGDISQLPPSVLAEMQRLDPKEYAALLKWGRDEMKPAPIVTSPVVMDKLFNMMTNDPERFKTYPLIKHSHELEKSEMKLFYNKQTDMRTNGPDNVQKPVAQINTYLDMSGYTDSDDKENRALFMFQALDDVTELEIREGRTATREEVRQINDDLMEEQVFDRKLWFDGTKPKFQFDDSDTIVKDDGTLIEPDGKVIPPEPKTRLYQIPTEAIREIRASFKKTYGRNPSVQEIIQTYNGANGL